MANDARTFMIFYFAITLLPFAIPVVHGATQLMSSLVLGMAAAIGSVTRRDQRHAQGGRTWDLRRRQNDLPVAAIQNLGSANAGRRRIQQALPCRGAAEGTSLPPAVPEHEGRPAPSWDGSTRRGCDVGWQRRSRRSPLALPSHTGTVQKRLTRRPASRDSCLPG